MSLKQLSELANLAFHVTPESCDSVNFVYFNAPVEFFFVILCVCQLPFMVDTEAGQPGNGVSLLQLL